MIKKTNAARILDQRKIKYELVSYTVDEKDLSAIHLALTANIPIQQVFKTLVLEGDKTGYFVCVIPGAKEVDLKKSAAISGNKKATLIPMKDLETVTGYIRGGCSPFGMKKNFPIYVDQAAKDHPQIYVSAGQRGLQILIASEDLIHCTNATVADLVASF